MYICIFRYQPKFYRLENANENASANDWLDELFSEIMNEKCVDGIPQGWKQSGGIPNLQLSAGNATMNLSAYTRCSYLLFINKGRVVE